MSVFNIFNSKNKEHRLQTLFEKIVTLLDSARNLYTQSGDLKKVVESEKNAVQQSSSASHEISSMVSATADAANDLNQTAKESNRAVENSSTALKELSQLIGDVDQASQTLQVSVKAGLKEIGSVTDTMSEIRNKAKIINEIVFQTKLLSFNASVEAARAGEHGKGFAIVAQEMGNLARASGEAAKEIEAILTASVDRTKTQIDKVTKDLENAASETIVSISKVSVKTNEISTAFQQLETFSQNTESKALEISNATNEQRIGVEEISKSLQHLENSSQKLDQMANDGNKNSADLSSTIESITTEFIEVGKILGYTVVKFEKPFDFESAIKAHIDWKMKLSKYIENPDGRLDHKKVCLDNACALGKWIYGEGQNYRHSNIRLFDEVKDSHAHFHTAASQIVELVNQNKQFEAKGLMGPSGTYIKISDKTIDLIQKLRVDVEKNIKNNAA